MQLSFSGFVSEVRAGKLTALVGVEDLWPALSTLATKFYFAVIN
jgi:hypothetical protein